MAEISSGQDLERWIKAQGRSDFAQVVAARVALRVLPYVFSPAVEQTWTFDFALPVLRATFLTWAVHNFPAKGMRSDSLTLAMRSAKSAAEAYRAAHVYDGAAVRCVSNSIDAHYSFYSGVREKYGYSSYPATAAAETAASAAVYFITAIAEEDELQSARAASRFVMWANVSEDCKRLESEASRRSVTTRMANQKLWTSGEPMGWDTARYSAFQRLAALQVGGDGANQQYKVWLDWYQRRVEGEASAFDIPGDAAHRENKAILKKLLDAGNEDFWEKDKRTTSALYPNSTLTRWIDEARERIASVNDSTEIAAASGSADLPNARHKSQQLLEDIQSERISLNERLTSLITPGERRLGDNSPPDDASLSNEIHLIVEELQQLEKIENALQSALEKNDVPRIKRQAQELNGWQKKMELLAGLTSKKVADGFENEIGAASARGLINVGQIALISAISAFLVYVYNVWIPILAGL